MGWKNYRTLKSKRVTRAIVASSGATYDYNDEWTGENQGGVTGDTNDAFGGDWTGWTEFEVMDEEVNQGEAEDGEKEDDEVMEDQPEAEEMRTEEDEAPRGGTKVKRKAEDEGDEERSRERERESA